jgi:crotonobetainyl-CoA:carnitine CoA-transferase CaiB-like acyl-CoA transferase
MWAGPLCASLLGQTGSEIIKVESTTRPDGARADATFYAWVHRDERQVSIAFDTEEGVAELRALLESADVVIESSRPRALMQLGLDPFSLELKEGMVWLNITGHGRRDAPDAVAFGDDAAVAGGLVGFDRGGDPVFCGDAIADPITGMLGAAVVLSSLERGGGELLDLSMARAASSMIDPFWWGTRPHFVTTDTTESEAIIIGGAILDVRRPAKPVLAV